MVEITPRRGPIFAAGLVAKNTITFSTNTMVSSWTSDPDNTPATPAIAYAAPAKTANAFVGTVSTTSGAINTGSGDIFGRIGTGGGTVTHNAGAILSTNPAGTGWDNGLVNVPFTSNLDTPVAPALPAQVNSITSSINSGTSLPQPGDVAAADGKYYYNFAAGAAVSLTRNKPLTLSHKGVPFLQKHALTPAGSSNWPAQNPGTPTGKHNRKGH